MFSVIIPLYNKENFVERTVRSVNKAFQGFKFEIVIINDGSSDKSGNVVDKLAINQDHVTVIHINNSGVSKARNIGINNAKYEYIVFVDADDVILEHAGSEYYNLIENYRDHGIYALAYALNKNNNCVEFDCKRALGKSSWFGTVDDPISVISKFKGSNFFSCSSICVKKDIVVRNNISFPVGVTHTEDLAFYLDMMLVSKVAFSSKTSVIYDLMAENRSASTKPVTERYIISKIKDIISNSSNVSVKEQCLSFLGKNLVHNAFNCIETNKSKDFNQLIKSSKQYFRYMSCYYKLVYFAFYFTPFVFLRFVLTR